MILHAVFITGIGAGPVFSLGLQGTTSRAGTFIFVYADLTRCI